MPANEVTDPEVIISDYRTSFIVSKTPSPTLHMPALYSPLEELFNKHITTVAGVWTLEVVLYNAMALEDMLRAIMTFEPAERPAAKQLMASEYMVKLEINNKKYINIYKKIRTQKPIPSAPGRGGWGWMLFDVEVPDFARRSDEVQPERIWVREGRSRQGHVAACGAWALRSTPYLA
uniref:Protein kinase domain-containing protein n=1 Tax=Coccidioides posadasii RMSCC 3488 TaxID=454284 RepID=A0A0J6FIQ9_COCPO|nr:hypothetical protein CPAG_09365 [Coccidioides posadasii RMSCC 3488]